MTILVFTCNISEQQAPGACWSSRLIYYFLIPYSLNSDHDWITSENEAHNFRLVKTKIFLHFFIPDNVKGLAVCLQKRSRTREMHAKPGMKWIASSSLEISAHLLMLPQVQGRIISISISWAPWSLIHYWEKKKRRTYVEGFESLPCFLVILKSCMEQ